MTKLYPVSCAIIAKNEADRIGRTIASVRDLVGEIVVVDSGSTDGTQELCRSLGARVIENAWPGFGPQKRFAEDNCRNDYILNLDADEWLSEALRDEFRSLLERGEPAQKAWRMRMTMVYPHRDRPAPFADYHDYVRFYDRRAVRFPQSAVHDAIPAPAGSPQFSAPAYHQSFRDFDHIIRKELDYYRQQRNELKKGKLWLGLRMFVEWPLQFLKFYIVRRHVFGGWYGLQVSALIAFLRWVRLAILMGR